MSYETRAYDNHIGDGFGNEPVVVVVVTGTHDVSRFVHLLAGGQPVVEQLELGKRIRSQVRRHSGGRAALKLLHRHGGPDFTREGDEESDYGLLAGHIIDLVNPPDEDSAEVSIMMDAVSRLFNVVAELPCACPARRMDDNHGAWDACPRCRALGRFADMQVSR